MGMTRPKMFTILRIYAAYDATKRDRTTKVSLATCARLGAFRSRCATVVSVGLVAESAFL